MKFFSAKPATIEIHHPDGEIDYRIVEEFSWEMLLDEGITMGYQRVGELVRDLGISDITVDLPGQLEGTTWPSEYRFLVRATDTYDAVASEQITTAFPMPIPVIQATIRGASMNSLQAIVDDNGDVLTMMLTSDAGVFMRYSGAWIDLNDPELLDGLDVIEVKDEALDIYDPLDQSGQTANITMFPIKPESGADVEAYMTVGASVIGDAATSVEALTASGVVIISSAKDIPAAVELATEHQEMRWYVERRIAALGLEYEVPW